MVSEQRFSVGDYDALYGRILMMGVADKMKLAMSGNQAALLILPKKSRQAGVDEPTSVVGSLQQRSRHQFETPENVGWFDTGIQVANWDGCEIIPV